MIKVTDKLTLAELIERQVIVNNDLKSAVEKFGVAQIVIAHYNLTEFGRFLMHIEIVGA